MILGFKVSTTDFNVDAKYEKGKVRLSILEFKQLLALKIPSHPVKHEQVREEIFFTTGKR